MLAVAVLTGYDGPAKLAAARPDLTVPDLHALQRLLGPPAPPSGPAPADTITVHDLKVESRIGVTPEERARPQDLKVTLAIVPPSGLTGLGDDLARTIDYDAVSRAARSLAATSSRRCSTNSTSYSIPPPAARRSRMRMP